MSVSARPRPTSGSVVKRLLVGRAFSSERLEHTLLPKWLALPVFSSDALSSVAYATEEILKVLLIASAAAVHLVTPIAIAIALLMAIVVASYRQTVRAYPSGGGAYIVSKENLGTGAGLIAAGALLVDYVMTVVVSTVAGVFAIISALPSLAPVRVELSVGFVLLITLANLRGVKEAGTLFAIPTYCFIVSIFALVAFGLLDCLNGCPASRLPPGIDRSPELAAAAGTVSLFVMLRAFSSGATALTGVEAISNGVPAFRRPQARNAAETLAIMGAIAIAMFLGISFLTTHVAGVTVSDDRSVVAQLAAAIFGESSVPFYLVQTFTAAILVLAANTAYQDFPRLSSILARDRFLPRQFMNRGDRLVFSNGVLVLGSLSCLVIAAFHADLTRLIQLYVVGVFTSFTLSQSGMVRHWRGEKHKGPNAQRGWQSAIVINAIGAVTTAVVLVVVTATKFEKGAWLSITVMVLLVPTFWAIHRHYTSVMEQLRRGVVRAGQVGANRVVLVVSTMDAATAEAVGYVRAVRPEEFHAIYPARGRDVPAEVRRRWREVAGSAVPPLEPVDNAGGDLLEAVRGYVSRVGAAPDDFVTVIIPELVRERLPFYLVRRRSLVRLKAGLLREPHVVVADAPVVAGGDPSSDGDARPLIPTRTVALVFVSAVHDATVRAVNYARSLRASETRAIYFDLDPETATTIGEEWAERGLDVPLDIVEAPFRDLGTPVLTEIRRYTEREDTLCAVVIPELVVRKWRHLVLHNQNALFLKRLLLYERSVVLSSVPFLLETDARRPVAPPRPNRSPSGGHA
jgi:amino acid transporter